MPAEGPALYVSLSSLEPGTAKIKHCSFEFQQGNVVRRLSARNSGRLTFTPSFYSSVLQSFSFLFERHTFVHSGEKKTLRALLELKPSYANFYFQNVHH